MPTNASTNPIPANTANKSGSPPERCEALAEGTAIRHTSNADTPQAMSRRRVIARCILFDMRLSFFVIVFHHPILGLFDVLEIARMPKKRRRDHDGNRDNQIRA